MRAGITVYAGPGFVFHWSFEDGFQQERAEHRTWRLGVVVAVRSVRELTDEAHRTLAAALGAVRDFHSVGRGG